MAEKPRDAVVKFDTYRNVQWHRTVLLAIARLLDSIYNVCAFMCNFACSNLSTFCASITRPPGCQCAAVGGLSSSLTSESEERKRE